MNYPRVTEILRATMPAEDKERLHKWEMAINSGTLPKTGKMTPAEQVRQEAMATGSTFHQAIQDYLETGKNPEFQSAIETKRWQKALPHLWMIKPNYLYLEQEVISEKHRYIGHLDCLIYEDNHYSIIDWKTSKRFKRKEWIRDYIIQGAAYGIAAKECGLCPQLPEEIRVYVFSPQRAQLFIEPISPYLEMWLERLAQFSSLRSLKNAHRI